MKLVGTRVHVKDKIPWWSIPGIRRYNWAFTITYPLIAEYPKAISSSAVNAVQTGNGSWTPWPYIQRWDSRRITVDGKIWPSWKPVTVWNRVTANVDNAWNLDSERDIAESDEMDQTDKTFSELLTLKNDSQLIPWVFYKITDPVDWWQIVVQALSYNQLSTKWQRLRTNEFRAYGFFRLSWTSWSVNAVNVNAVNQLTAVIPFNTTAYQTLVDVATNINANGARVVNAVACRGDITLDQPYMVLERLVGGVNTNAITVVTTTLSAWDIGNMKDWAASTNVVYDIEYVFSTTNANSRITRCIDATANTDIRTNYTSATSYNPISWIDSTWAIIPWFYRRWHGYSKDNTINNLVWRSCWMFSFTGIVAWPQGNINADTFWGSTMLWRWNNLANITATKQLVFQDSYSWGTFSMNNFTCTGIQLFTFQSLGNLTMSNCSINWTMTLTTRVSHTSWTSTISWLFTEWASTLTLILARAVWVSPAISLWIWGGLVLNIASTASWTTLNGITIGNRASFSLTQTGTGSAWLSDIIVESNNNCVATITWTWSNFAGARIRKWWFSLSAPNINISNLELFWSTLSITSANDIDLSNTYIKDRTFSKYFSKTWLNGWANNWLAWSPIYLGNLPDNFWATETDWEATWLTGVWALLQLWIETDDDDAMIPATAIGTLTDRLIFDTPTNTQANAVDRRIVATPTVANITAGQFQWTVRGIIGL